MWCSMVRPSKDLETPFSVINGCVLSFDWLMGECWVSDGLSVCFQNAMPVRTMSVRYRANIIAYSVQNKRVYSVKKRHHNSIGFGLDWLLGCVSHIMASVFFCLASLSVAYATPDTKVQTDAATQRKQAEQPVYLVTVPMVGLLIQDLISKQARVITVSDSLDYHAPQLTPKQLQGLIEITDIVWFGADFEPQMQGLVEKIAVQSQARVIRLPVSDQEGAVQQFEGRKHLDHAEAKHDHREHHHGHDHTFAHPWLHVGTLKAWAEFLTKSAGLVEASTFAESSKIEPSKTGAAKLKSAKNHKAWLVAFDQMISQWQRRFAQLENRSFVQEHASLEPLAHTFNLMPVGSLTSHHDTVIGVRELWNLTKEVRQQNTTCFIAMPNSEIKIPPTLFRGTPEIRPIDPLGKGLVRASETEGFASVSFVSDILAEVYGCLSGA